MSPPKRPSARGLGEFELIEAIDRLAAPAVKRAGKRVMIGIGDDAAVVRSGSNDVMSVDAMVEGVHFKRDWMPPSVLGARSVAVSFSDLAAMGAKPRFALLALTIPSNAADRYLKEVCRGFLGACDALGVALLGGNITRGRDLSLSVTALGEAETRLLRRDGAGEGQTVLVTGNLGSAAAGVAMLQSGKRRGKLIDAYRRPPDRTRLACRLARMKDVVAAIDISDGLVSDLTHVAQASGVSIAIDRSALPVASALQTAAKRGDVGDPAELVLSGGEDYELALFVDGGEAKVRRIMKICRSYGTTATPIGVTTSARRREPVSVDDGGAAREGWTHF